MSIITIEPEELLIDSENFVYSKTSSRPSKSIVNPELYTKYKSIKDIFSFFDSKCKCDYLLRECLSYVFSNIQKIQEDIYILNEKIYKIIQFTDNKFKNLNTSLNDKYENYIIISNDIYTYPKIQYFYILSNYFESINIIMSQIMNYNIIVCNKRNKNLDINFKNSIVKDFGIKVHDSIIKYIYQDNNYFLQDSIDTNNKISNICCNISQISNLNRDIYTVNKYYKAFINKECNIDCNCKSNNIFYSDILECYICEKCLVLTRLFPF